MTVKPTPLLVTETAAELLKRELPPIRMVVGNHIPAGLILLAGDPKAGKSLLCQDLAISVATGQAAWGSLEIEEGDVLYLAREGGDRSFRQRLQQMLGSSDAPERLDIAYSSEGLGGELETQLEWWLSSANDPRLVVIDTFAAVAPTKRTGNVYSDDYASLSGLADLATRWADTLFIVVHHTRKAESEDVMQRISGSNGMTGATDGNAVLTRHTAALQCVLSVRPRNAEESELVLQRDSATLRWTVVQGDERAALSGGRQRILGWFDLHPEGGSPKMIAGDLEMSHDQARQFLVQMEKARQVVRSERGWYKLPESGEHTEAA